MAAISTVFVTICVFLGCENGAIEGIDLQTAKKSLVQGCNAAACACSEIFTPICGVDGLSYYNPCYAGCLNFTSSNGTYANCMCVGSNQNNVTANLAGATATSGLCAANCGSMLGVFMLFFFLFLLFTFMNHTPSTAILMRVVPVSHKSLSLGMNDFIYKLIGTIPGPLAFGAAFDDNCVVNSASCAGTAGACVVYNNYKIRLILFLALGTLFKCLSTFFNTVSIRSIKHMEDATDATAKLTPAAENPEETEGGQPRTVRSNSIEDAALVPGLVSEAMGEIRRESVEKEKAEKAEHQHQHEHHHEQHHAAHADAPAASTEMVTPKTDEESP